MTDFRDLCTELLLFAEQAGEICHNEGLWPNCDQQQVCVDGKPLWMLDRVRAALAEPKPEAPTDEDLFLSLEQLRDKWNAQSDAFNTWDELGIDEIVWWAQRQALARWGNHPGSPDSSTLQPVPITERLPEPEDCDGEGNVWAWRRFDPEGGMDNGDFWCLAFCEWLGDEDSGFTHWLPAHALPVPS